MSNRQRILEIGLVLFAQNGYEATGVQEICDRAEITKPTLYHYFGNKQGLLESILEERFKPFLSLLEAACHYRRDLTLNIQRVIEAYFLFASRDLQLYQLLTSCSYHCAQDPRAVRAGKSSSLGLLLKNKPSWQCSKLLNVSTATCAGVQKPI